LESIPDRILEPPIVTGLLLIAAYRDFATRSIPNRVSALLAICGLITRALAGPSALAWALGSGAALFSLLLVAHTRGVLGGGDVKLMAAVACGLALPELYRFIVLTAVAGGILAVIHLSLRCVLKGPPPVYVRPRRPSGWLRVLTVERWRVARRGPLPYGIAIACGGIVVVGSRFPW
jgi:prepilin peptidase CpaA